MKKTKKELYDFNKVFEPDDYLYFYEEVLTSERTEKEVNFLIKELNLTSDSKILDLACGHGRHSNKLAELGYNVTGVDINSGFLKIARETARTKKLNVKYIKNDMRKIKFKKEFDRVLLLFTAFGYFSDEENQLVLKNISTALKKNGLLCFDTFNRDTFLKNFVPYIVVKRGKDLMIDENSFDSLSGRVFNHRITIRNGKRKDKPFSVRLYNPTEIKYELEQAGFKLFKIYGSLNGLPFTAESRRMVIIAQKP